MPVAGDWNGDGIRQIGVFRDGRWHLDLNGDGRFTEVDATVEYGTAGDLPVVGDFDGNGFEEIGVFRAGQWIVDVDRNREMDAQDKVFELGARMATSPLSATGTTTAPTTRASIAPAQSATG